MLGALGGGLLNLAGNLYNVNAQKQANAQNLAFAKEQFAYQQQLNNLAMQREDTAVQRRVADLENAGFNKRLAMDQSAGAQSLSAGNYNAGQQAAMMDPSSVLAGITGSIESINRIRTTEADLRSTDMYIKLQQAQTLKTLKEAGLIDKQGERIAQEIINFEQQRENWYAERLLTEQTTKMYAEQERYFAQQTKQKEYENKWSEDHEGQPIPVYTAPFNFSGNVSGGAFGSNFGFGLNFSAPSGGARDAINSGRDILQHLRNKIEDEEERKVVDKALEEFDKKMGLSK